MNWIAIGAGVWAAGVAGMSRLILKGNDDDFQNSGTEGKVIYTVMIVFWPVAVPALLTFGAIEMRKNYDAQN